ncbi:initiation-specific alpha-1,6-mannosyltransferase [Colletotrichum graminicola]|nr:initiation-specific alpha-1,6-mannosyltransferase [Colletotrichum graminicola]
MLEKVIYNNSRRRYQPRLWVGINLILLLIFLLYGTSGSINQRLFNNKFTSIKSPRPWEHNSTPSEWMKARPDHLIPPKIWQIVLPKGGKNAHNAVDSDILKETATWLAKNQDYT